MKREIWEDIQDLLVDIPGMEIHSNRKRLRGFNEGTHTWRERRPK